MAQFVNRTRLKAGKSALWLLLTLTGVLLLSCLIGVGFKLSEPVLKEGKISERIEELTQPGLGTDALLKDNEVILEQAWTTDEWNKQANEFSGYPVAPPGTVKVLTLTADFTRHRFVFVDSAGIIVKSYWTYE